MAQQTMKSGPSGKALEVLVVEDHEDTAGVYSDYLTAYGISVIVARNGLEGWEMYRERRCDVVVADMGLQGLDGIGLLQRIREQDSKTRFLFVTGRSKQEIISEVLARLGKEAPYDYMRKPVSFDKLLAYVIKDTGETAAR